MPNHPNDRHHQDIRQIWRGTGVAGRFPAQPPYRGTRADLPWGELNRLPAGTSTRNLGAH
ncbi:hypothetical protein GA0070616_3858 [Micromonospora nigra]|uniref:DNA repair protein n=1 Tax=Micromonospora nigra TaxID=145857 RepID=A0A1C6SII0_9ACTN|nr:hypothetical protein [Micromonospora nigra]SCL29296.1 hypothetical protein GA0070616_3858 [Micromonospora nigra]